MSLEWFRVLTELDTVTAERDALRAECDARQTAFARAEERAEAMRAIVDGIINAPPTVTVEYVQHWARKKLPAPSPTPHAATDAEDAADVADAKARLSDPTQTTRAPPPKARPPMPDETTPAPKPQPNDSREAQRRGFAYGNAVLSDPNVTREHIDEAARHIVGTLVLTIDPNAPVPRRITTAQFEADTSGWLRLAKGGQQIQVVGDAGAVELVIGAGGWYANPTVYEEAAPLPGKIDGVVPVEQDKGKFARAVLAVDMASRAAPSPTPHADTPEAEARRACHATLDRIDARGLDEVRQSLAEMEAYYKSTPHAGDGRTYAEPVEAFPSSRAAACIEMPHAGGEEHNG